MIALFIKPPVPGRIKTRLARDIGDMAACSLYRAIAEHVVQQIQASGFPLALFFDGDDPSQLPDTWKQPAYSCIRQQGADLGERMVSAFKQLFADGTRQVVLIGSDIPDIDAAYLRQAFSLLADHALVIGPALDGGYCLIGFNQGSFSASIFQDIPWSTDQVLERTLTAAKQACLSVGLLKPLRDIDTVDDLQYIDLAALRLTDC